MNLANPALETNVTQRGIVAACKTHLDSLVTVANPKPLVEMVIFHAERHTSGSNFKLDLRGFVKQRSSCEETCGDAIVTIGEVCDDGINDGQYGGCSADCQMRSARCGDGVVNGPEACDKGAGQNLGGYNGCNPDCTKAPYCGDGVRQGAEECDDGNTNQNDGCTNECVRPLL